MNEGAQSLPLVEVAEVVRSGGLWGSPAGWPWLSSRCQSQATGMPGLSIPALPCRAEAT